MRVSINASERTLGFMPWREKERIIEAESCVSVQVRERELVVLTCVALCTPLHEAERACVPWNIESASLRYGKNRAEIWGREQEERCYRTLIEYSANLCALRNPFNLHVLGGGFQEVSH
jgi:hypothetical protein